MSLLQKASIITTPTAYAEDYLYSIKPAYALGSELITNGDFADNSWWQLSSSNVNISNGKGNFTAGTTEYFYKNNTLTIGKAYKVTFEITDYTTGYISAFGGNWSGPAVSVGTYVKYINNCVNTTFGLVGNTFVGSIDNVSVKEITDADFDFDRNSTGTRVNEDYLIETVATNTPRIDYTNGEPSILLEPSRTNSFDYSQDFSDTYWDKVGVTVGSNVATSPEGITNASKIKENSGGTYHNINWDGSVTSGTTYTVSVFLKASERTTASIYENVGIGGGTYPLSSFNLVTGEVDAENTNHTANIENYGNGWFRCSITFTADGTRSGSIYIAPNNTLTYTGVTNSGVFIYGAQFEVGSYATSLIHTSGSAVTRSADRADNAGNSDLINSTEGVFYLQFAALTGAGAFDDLSLSDGTQNNKVQLFYRATDKINARVTVGGVNVFDHIYQSIDMTQFEKVAIKWKLNDFSMYVDGREVDSDSSGATFTANTLNEVKINDNNISDYVGKIKCLAVFKEALTDLELAKLTGYNNHELYMNYYNRLSYLGLVEEYNVESDINNYIL